MAKPITLLQQQKEDIFRPTNTTVVQFATAKYNQVWSKDDDGKISQAMIDLGDVVKQDCKLIEDSF